MEAVVVSVCSEMNESCFSFCTNVNQLWVKYNVKLPRETKSQIGHSENQDYTYNF